jgi:micrococcal nuclease
LKGLRAWVRLVALAALVGLSFAAAAAAPTRQVDGKVTYVSDGDSLWLAPADGGAPLEVRLQDIDAPEICQPWGPEAREALQALVLGKAVRLQVSGRDVHGRTLATVYLDALNVNQALVKEGHAWSGRYRNDRGRYVAEERMAKALGRGLNRAGGAVMPKDFRRDHGPCQSAEGGPAALAAPSAAPSSPDAAATTQGFHCDGRLYCSQMRSCAEATYFLNHCPGVKMDGNGDGVPCEQQWCRR